MRLPAQLLAIPLLATLAGTGAHAEDVVRVGWLRGTNDITLGKARGTLEKALAAKGARVEWDGPFPASAPAVEALAANAIDITVGSSTSSVASLAAKAPIMLFAYQKLSADGEALVVKKDSPIRSIADLAGHSVAVNRGGTGEYLLMRALETHGVDPAKVKRVYLGPADAGPAFASGAVDAMAAWDPFLSIALAANGGRVLANGTEIGSENAIVMIARRGFAADHPALLRAFYDALREDNDWSVTNRDAAGEIWARELHVPESLAATFGRNDAVPTGPVTPADTLQIQNIAAWYVSSGIVPEKPDLAGAALDFSK